MQQNEDMQMIFSGSTIFAWLCAIAMAFFSLSAAQGAVVINEVESNPAGEESAFKATATAWFELHNTDDKDIDLSGWSIKNSDGRSITFPQGTVIRAIDYYVQDVRPGWLAQDNEVLVLIDTGGAEVDRTAALTDEDDNEMAWTRDPDGRDTESIDDWKYLASSRGF
jgi:hypothetical protein